VATPREAIENGSDYLVIGRPITQAENPIQVLQQLNEEIAGQQEV
jgi:orotidine-5'-phosphate decarboxylase